MSPRASLLETGTTAHTGLACFAITMVADTVFTTLTGMTGDSVAGVTFSAGVTIYGNFSAVTLASGAAVIYLA